jgi:hypothetical protein
MRDVTLMRRTILGAEAHIELVSEHREPKEKKKGSFYAPRFPVIVWQLPDGSPVDPAAAPTRRIIRPSMR